MSQTTTNLTDAEIDGLSGVEHQFGRGKHPCRTCGVGHHHNGKCDMCEISTVDDDAAQQRWWKRRIRIRQLWGIWRGDW